MFSQIYPFNSSKLSFYKLLNMGNEMDNSEISKQIIMESLETSPNYKSILSIMNNVTLTESENIAIINSNTKHSVLTLKNGMKFIDSLDRKLKLD